jgi:predicted DNA-binding protein with PD1-like motif
MQFITIKINPGEEVMATLEKEFHKRSIPSGALVSIIGAVDECCISNMPKDDATKDLLHEYNEPFELSGTGEIKDGKPHIHCVLGKEDDTALTGHLHWARVKTWYVAVYALIP